MIFIGIGIVLLFLIVYELTYSYYTDKCLEKGRKYFLINPNEVTHSIEHEAYDYCGFGLRNPSLLELIQRVS